ncbi:MAG: hypothetical protein WC829_19550 [Hyphomicrobium sp.]|jgi:hypothetical protein
MRSATTCAVLLAIATLATPALAFDVQNSGGTPGSSANLAPDASAPGVSLDMDLRSQLGLGEDKTAGMASKSGLQFGGSVFSGSGNVNTTTMGYDERPWVAPRRPPGRD